MKTRLFLMTAAAALAMTVSAMAQEPGEKAADAAPEFGKDKVEMMMQKADTNGDGMISKEEFMAKHEKRFTEIDTSGDGQLSKDEMQAHREAMKAKRMERRDDMHGKTGDGEHHGEHGEHNPPGGEAGAGAAGAEPAKE